MACEEEGGSFRWVSPEAALGDGEQLAQDQYDLSRSRALTGNRVCLGRLCRAKRERRDAGHNDDQGRAQWLPHRRRRGRPQRDEGD
ncbi:Os11g0417016 [Oryza sativa Japonica Group]|uniref:Os11g0417016 protein n=1 Tax=Oryza sativa subsp. japonica TaxID=39947 RepID=A0A0P0Y1V7_ORYSJ|nr:Os11g0417016 [Oryza sativa Japonica Group]